MKEAGPNSTSKSFPRPKSSLSKAEPARHLIDQCPHRIVGVMHLPGCDIEAPQYESPLEHSAIRLLALCGDVKKISSQTERINYIDQDGVERTYTLDLLIELADGEALRIEVKPLKVLLTSVNQDKYAAIARAYLKRQKPFDFLTSDALLVEPRHSIARRLRLYLAAEVPVASIEALYSYLERGPLTIGALKDRVPLSHIYALVARNQLCISWKEKFDSYMTVSLPNQPYAPLSYAALSNQGQFRPLVQELVLGRRPTNQRLLAAALSKDKSISLPSPIGSVEGYPRRALLVGRNFRQQSYRADGYGDVAEVTDPVDASAQVRED
ncbi:hypothetical protein FDZ73_15505 [bacterium]|nr:MAG: hypothetical protein FDZ73_15505 [bacterium]